MASLPFRLHYKPKLGNKRDFGIGIVGAGGIVETAHLPAYRKAGFNVVGITDLSLPKAEGLATQFHIPRAFRSIDELLADPEVEIVDVAVPPWEQAAIVRRALQARKHLLCQKPLAVRVAEASALVEEATRVGCQLAVNENMRWDPAMRASRHLLEEGWIGSPFLATVEINYWENWESWPWLIESKYLTVLYDAIHPLYSLRMLFGDPEMVFCATGRVDNQKPIGETRAVVVLQFASGLTGLLVDSSTNPTDDQFATFRFDGTEGSIKGALGIWYDIPVGRADVLEFCSRSKSDGFWVSSKLEGRWIPDAFIGSMGALMKGIEELKEPENSGREHLKTLRLVEAAYRSAREGQAVNLQQLDG